ncbi:hypothetical protein HMPREF1550_00148 [Actinomyces sp. oral taxon 877 str. F0543]|nr:hypothetical protein HMPREF1550_00148 [Actinomyces sp. oral taxon 877 str. F0543]
MRRCGSSSATWGASSCGCWSRPRARGGLVVQDWESASQSQIVFDFGAPRGCRTI